MVDREGTGCRVVTSHTPFRREEVLTRRPRVLFLAWPFPPANESGSVRTWNVAKHLARLGWDVTVVTPCPSVWKKAENVEKLNIELEREGIRRILTGHQWCCLSPGHLNYWSQGLGWFMGGVCRRLARRLDIDQGVGWVRPAEQTCSTLTAKDVDIIIATGKPFAAFRLAKRLADKLGRPYVLDYRDPWTGNPHEAHSVKLSTIQKEARLLAGCAAVTIVSHSWSLALEHRFGLGAKLHVVTNGYDPEELADVKPYDFGHFAIVYTGRFYPPKRVISPVMAALRRLRETTPDKDGGWYFHYYGEQENHVREEAERFDVMERVVLHGMVPRHVALSAVRGAGVAVVITSVADEVTMEDKGIVTGKVFEALGLKTPVLLVAPSGSDVETIVETAGLGHVFTAHNVESIAAFLDENLNGQTPKLRHPEAYAWTNIVKKMDAVLRAAMRTTVPRQEPVV